MAWETEGPHPSYSVLFFPPRLRTLATPDYTDGINAPLIHQRDMVREKHYCEIITDSRGLKQVCRPKGVHLELIGTKGDCKPIRKFLLR